MIAGVHTPIALLLPYLALRPRSGWDISRFRAG